jgi:hypothetical protein
MELIFNAAAMIAALDFVQSVEPRALSNQAKSEAYLFKCTRDQAGKPVCTVYSRSKDQVARAIFPLNELDGEGVFTLPKTHVEVIRHVPDDTVTLNSHTETKSDGEVPYVTIRSSSGTKYEHSTFNPALVTPCDKEYEAAAQTTPVDYPLGILREALRMASPFLPGDKKDNVAEHFNTVQIFDQSNPDLAKGDGNLFCADGTRAFFFESEEFKNKGFTVHSHHLATLQAFLSKCEGVRMYHHKNLSYAVNLVAVPDPADEKKTVLVEKELFCWSNNVKTHSRFFYYAPTRDKFILIAPKSTLLNSLDQASVLIDEKRERIKLVYQFENKDMGGSATLHFGSSESAGKIDSFPVPTVDKKDEPSLKENFEYFVTLKSFRTLIDGATGQEIELRFNPLPKDDAHPRGGAMLRTIDTLHFDSAGKLIDAKSTSGTPRYTCKVTRFMPSVT